MPCSKKPRKRGLHGKRQTALKLVSKGTFKSDAQKREALKTLRDQERSISNGVSLFAWMNDLSDPETLLKKFATAYFALRRWKETIDPEDINCVTRLLTIGGLCHKEMDVYGEHLFREIQNACFQSIICIQFRNQNKEIPDANIDAIHVGLRTAEALIEFTNEHDHGRLISIIRKTDPAYVQAHPGLEEERERWLLGEERLKMAQNWMKNTPDETVIFSSASKFENEV